MRSGGEYVLYWMIASRRVRWNFALDRAAEWAAELGKPILILEALRTDYPWASDRIHRFVVDGMRDNAAALSDSGIGYHPYVEPSRGAGKGLLAALAARASVVVTDEFPCFFLPRMVAAAAARLDVKLETVDSNGLLPLAAPGKAFQRAFDFRRYLQRELPDHLGDPPRRSVQEGPAPPRFKGLPKDVRGRWPRAADDLLAGRRDLAALPIDHAVNPVAESGGYVAGQRALRRFLRERLSRYGAERNQPDVAAASELSAYLHFGHVSAHQVLDAVARETGWSPFAIDGPAGGQRRGWWGLDESTESFLDELVTWRELGYGFCFHRPDYAEYGSLSDWALETLAEHERDPRPWLYGREDFEQAATHDEIWNAAQRELKARGRIHNYLRMLWGKKILHWTRTPRAALHVMIELNNKYAIDGRNPNSYSGIFWVLGRFDRAWGPEREVFGKVRYMSSRNTRRKLRLDGYLKRWGEQPPIA
ncbi:MAG: deoxyribodipyrimidine photolyase [Acidobacteriota bacterium]|nr:deoxyribodipyrimidine photolyase [Acidobacteriota bacterium]